jgi:Phosphotransferase enzyme family
MPDVNIAQVLRDAAAALIGPCEVTEFLGPAVARVATREGREYVVKKHATQDKHDREVHAYRHWTIALGLAAPELIAAEPQARAIITTALPAWPRTGTPTAAAHHRAGTLLRRFHAAEAPRPLPGYRTWLQDRCEHWLAQASPFLGRPELYVAAARLEALRETAAHVGVPCHLDFQDRNWLHDRVGHLYLVDFEHARTDHPLRDLVRLRFRIWPVRPDLKEAFLAGYGRDLTGDDNQTLLNFGALDALTAIGRGHQTSDAHLIESGHDTLRQLCGSGPLASPRG